MSAAGGEQRKLLLGKEDIDDWLETASAGDILIYARVQFLPRGALGPAYIRLLHERGVVAPTQKRIAEDVFEYRAQRTTRRGSGGGRGARRKCGTRAIGDAAWQVLDVIEEAAGRGACPSESEIAAMLDMASVRPVKRALETLVDAGRIAFATQRGPDLLPRRIAVLPDRAVAGAYA